MINKFKIPVLILLALIIFIGLPVLLVIKNRNTKPQAVTTALPEENKEVKTLTYTDTSGFQFDYPEGLTIKDISGNDNSVYSVLEITSDKETGKIVVKIVDSQYPTTEAYLKSKEATGAGAVRDVTLSEFPAKQIQYVDKNKLVTMAISDAIMYSVESPREGAFWNKVHSQIISSLKLGEPGASETVQESGGSGNFSSEEEVIE